MLPNGCLGNNGFFNQHIIFFPRSAPRDFFTLSLSSKSPLLGDPLPSFCSSLQKHHSFRFTFCPNAVGTFGGSWNFFAFISGCSSGQSCLFMPFQRYLNKHLKFAFLLGIFPDTKSCSRETLDVQVLTGKARIGVLYLNTAFDRSRDLSLFFFKWF